MNIDKAVLAFAGCVVLVSVALAQFVSPWWLLLTLFAGAIMLQASVTGFCPAAMVFKKLGCCAGNAFHRGYRPKTDLATLDFRSL